MVSTVRQPAVAGRFYPGEPSRLRADLKNYLEPAPEKTIKALGCVVPHAGYMYSGHVAGAVYRKLELPSRFLLLCPNHTGMGEPLAVVSEGAWETPLGPVPIDTELASNLKAKLPLLHEDSLAHRREHAVEVHLPFLQVLVKEFRFVPIVVGTSNFEVLSALGVVIGNVLRETGEPVLIIASSDMNHYEDDDTTRVKDSLAIEQVLERNPLGLYQTVQGQQISMCGYGPAIAMLTAAGRLGAQKAELIKYATSGDISGDRNEVVGYAGIVVY